MPLLDASDTSKNERMKEAKCMPYMHNDESLGKNKWGGNRK